MADIEFMCSMCGQKQVRNTSQGRPLPGKCPRARTEGRPHRWVKNREVGIGGRTVSKTPVAERYMMVGGKKVKI